MSGSVLAKSRRTIETKYRSATFYSILKKVILNFSEPQFIHLRHGANDSISLHRGFKIIHAKGLSVPCLPYSKSSANAGYYYLGVGLLLPWGVAELLLGPRGGLGVVARVAARGRRPEPAPREAAAVSRRVAAPVGPRPGPVRRRVVWTPVPVPRGWRPRTASARGTPEAAPATPTSYTRAGARRSRGSEILSVHLRRRKRGPQWRVLPPELSRPTVHRHFVVLHQNSPPPAST